MEKNGEDHWETKQIKVALEKLSKQLMLKEDLAILLLTKVSYIAPTVLMVRITERALTTEIIRITK